MMPREKNGSETFVAVWYVLHLSHRNFLFGATFELRYCYCGCLITVRVKQQSMETFMVPFCAFFSSSPILNTAAVNVLVQL